MSDRDDPIVPPVKVQFIVDDAALLAVMRFSQTHKVPFWDYVEDHYPEYWSHMKWYGDMEGTFDRIWKKYKLGRKS